MGRSNSSIDAGMFGGGSFADKDMACIRVPYSSDGEVMPCLVRVCAHKGNHFAYGEAPYNPPESSGVSASFRLAFCWLTKSVGLLLF